MREELKSVMRDKETRGAGAVRKLGEELRAIEPDVYWGAVMERDARFDGLFVYAVRSTGIYCKPSCPSRRPRREQVSFFASCEEAEGRGFRACRRCLPREPSAVDPALELVLRVCAFVEEREGEAVSLEELGERERVSPQHLQRTFKRVTGITPRQYAAAHRLRRFKSKIKGGRGVTDALYEAGYGSSSRLYEGAAHRLGMTPATYRRGGEGMEINYMTKACALGRLLVAATARGICSVQFGDTDAELEAALAEEYPSAKISRGGARLEEFAEALLGHLDGRETSLDLPTDVRATAFQSRVWEELRRIPYGETRSYAEVAAGLGQPKAVRAVARACATNPVALINPCHRVVRGDGGLSGYRWGVGRKRALLAREREGARGTVTSIGPTLGEGVISSSPNAREGVSDADNLSRLDGAEPLFTRPA